MDGTAFGRYQLIELLGRGGMGEVWRARDTTIDRTVAIKMLLPRYAKDPEYEKRFRREAHAAARLDDPHVVPIYDIGEIDGRLFVSMRLVKGWDLQTLLDSAGPLPPPRIVAIVEQVAGALHSAHRTGLVHRDVKPSNILLTETDYAYLIDFGIARAASDTALTAADTTLGTWAYMSPERFNTGGEIGPAADVYALACVLHQGLTGNLPFPGDTFEQIAVSHMVMPPPRPSEERAGVPVALDDVVATGLAKQPADRYPGTTDLAAAARSAIAGLDAEVAAPLWSPPPAVGSDHTRPWQPDPPAPPPPPHRRRAGLLIGAAAAAALLVAGGVFAATRPTSGTPPAVTGTTPSPLGTPLGTGPFTGVFSAEFEPSTEAPVEYAVRSVCGAAGCVAAATRLSDDTVLAADVAFDEVGNQWLSVEVASGRCGGADAETWQAFRLRPRPDGTLSGEHSTTTTDGCAETRAVTLTRTRALEPSDRLPTDPAGLPARVVSPAEALRGRYHLTRTFTDPTLPEVQADGSVTTDCLRTGDRCMSYIAAGDIPLVFSNGAWAWSQRSTTPCDDGSPSQLTVSARFPIPQPPLNPVPALTGEGTWVRTAACAVTSDFTQTLVRTGQ